MSIEVSIHNVVSVELGKARKLSRTTTEGDEFFVREIVIIGGGGQELTVTMFSDMEGGTTTDCERKLKDSTNLINSLKGTVPDEDDEDEDDDDDDDDDEYAEQCPCVGV